MAWLDSLRPTRLFEHFSTQHVALLNELGEVRSVESGSVLCSEGKSSSSAFVVISGNVESYRTTQLGDFVFGRLNSGETFGELVFLDQDVRVKSVRAASDSEIAALDSNLFRSHMDSDLKLRIAVLWWVWKSLSDKIRTSNRMIARFFDSASDKQRMDQLQGDGVPTEYRIPIGDKRRLFEEQRLSSMEIHFLSSLSKARKLAANEILFREGDSAEHMFVVLDGHIRISKRIPGVGEEALTVLERGDYFGEMALFDERHRSADARANSDGTVVLMISQEVMKGVLDINNISSVRLLEILSGLLAKRLREVDEKLLTWFLLSGGVGSYRDEP